MQAETKRQIEAQIADLHSKALERPSENGPVVGFGATLLAAKMQATLLAAEKVMPTGYELREGACGGHWVRRPDGSFLRGRDLAPPDLAIEAAIEDQEKGHV